MKKIIKNLLIITIILLPKNIFAEETDIKVTLTCEKSNLLPGESINCSIAGNSTEKTISAIEGIVVSDELLTISNFKINEKWDGTFYNNKLTIFTYEEIKNNFDIATFEIRASNIEEEVTVALKLKDTFVIYEDYSSDSVAVTPLGINISSSIEEENDALSTDKTLSNIKIDGEAITNFSNNKYIYDIEVPANKKSIKIAATPTSDKSKVTLESNYDLKYGNNRIDIKVTSESNSSQIYTLYITRKDDRKLKTLTINGENIELEVNKFRYYIEIENEVDTVKIEAFLNNETESIFIDNYGARTINNLKIGNNEILIKTSDKDNQQLTYYLNIIRLNEEEIIKEEIEEDKNTSSNSNKNEENNITKNPTTGGINIVIIIVICITSLSTVLMINKQITSK